MSSTRIICFSVFIIIPFLGEYCAEESPPKSYRNYKLIEAKIQSREQATRLINMANIHKLDIWRLPSEHIPALFIVAPEQLQLLRMCLETLKIPSRVQINDIQSLIDKERISNQKAIEKDNGKSGLRRSQAPLDNYARYDNISAWLKRLEAENPLIAKVFVIGKSYQGRDVLALRLGSGSSMSKPQIYIDGCIHGNEWLGCATVIYITNRLFSENSTNTSALLQKFDWWIVPVVNPDGYEYTHSTDRLWRKTLSANSGSPCFGTDPNRNFDSAWGSAGASSEPCLDNYHGQFPASELEVRNIQALLQQIRPKAYFNFHAFGQYWLTPLGYKPELPPTHNEMIRVAKIGSDAIRAVHGREFEFGNSCETLYPSSGDCVDYAYEKAGVAYAQTIEVRPADPFEGAFLMGPEHIVPSGEENYAGVVAAVLAMRV